MDWKLVGLAFGTLFLAELGDKTQLAVFTMVAKHKNIGSIFLGAAAALVAVTAIGALAGGWIRDHLPPEMLQSIAGVLFLGMGIKTLCDSLPGMIRLFVK